MKIETKWKDIPTLVTDEQVVREYEAMERYAEEAYNNLGRGLAIEVGSFWGRSTALLAQFFTVFAIDTWGLGTNQGARGEMKEYDDFAGPALDTFFKNMTDRDLIYWDHAELSQDRIHAICSTSKFLENVPYLDVRFCFVDAEHSYPASYYDMKRCADHMAVGGIMALHDCARPTWGWAFDEGVERSDMDPWWENLVSLTQFLDENRKFTIYDHVEGMVFVKKMDKDRTYIPKA